MSKVFLAIIALALALWINPASPAVILALVVLGGAVWQKVRGGGRG